MLTLPFQILTQLCFNENEADVETESQPYRGREFQSVFENFNADHQVTIEDENELAEREVFPKTINEQTYLEKLNSLPFAVFF